jgi:hypothetical protein
MFIVLVIYRWCRDCVHLHMELFVNRSSERENNPLFQTVIKLFSEWNLYDGLKWMISLKELCVLINEPDCCFDEFCRWILREINPPNLERLWIPSTKLSLSPSQFKSGPSLKCFNIGSLDKGFDMASLDFTQLTHLSGIKVDSDLKLPQLRFLRGEFSSCSVRKMF